MKLDRRSFLAAIPAATLAAVNARADLRRTAVAIEGEHFLINGHPTYEGRTYKGMKVEGLLMNSRMVQGIFDDSNPATRPRWRYPDTGKWDPERNTREFVAAMPEWRRHGLLSFTVNLQGGCPEGYCKQQPWINTTFRPDGTLKPPYLRRLERILDRANELGMAPIVSFFYFGQDQHLRDEGAVKRGVEEATHWLLSRPYRNVLVEIDNECDVKAYDHAILTSSRVHELINLAKSIRLRGERLRVSASFGGGSIPTDNAVAAADFVLMHGNGVSNPARIAEMVREVRRRPSYRPMPVLFNEDDHFDFDKPVNNMLSAVGSYASWGYFDPGKSDYRDGYQCPPVNWGINTPRKKAFFGLLKEVTGA
ncbi:MAG: hypothetical protein P8Z30_05945 [Acidobacteriota bacterium]